MKSAVSICSTLRFVITIRINPVDAKNAVEPSNVFCQS